MRSKEKINFHTFSLKNPNLSQLWKDFVEKSRNPGGTFN